MMRAFRRLLQVLFGLVLGLVLAEAMFRIHDHGAFPHLNLYLADAALGVRLQPGGTERISFGGNPVTSVRINAAGYRGADWGPPTHDEVAVVGDSQVFGLGVEEGETTAAVLAGLTGRPVLNAGVPTYGPPEYLAVIDELLATRHPATVVLVINFANDLFELHTPDLRRHAVWDGWAVRLETAPDHVTEFPGRHWLYAQSHLFLAMRRALWTPPTDWGRGVASEGTWARVVTAAAQETVAPAGAGEGEVAAAVGDAASARSQLQGELEFLYRDVFPDAYAHDEDLALRAVRGHAFPGDIVGDINGEEARGLVVTAELLRQGAAIGRDMEPKLAAWVAEHPDAPQAERVRAALASRKELDAELQALGTRVAPTTVRSALADFVQEARDHCAAAGAELTVVALPLDVQVSAAEWAKYGTPGVEMGSTRVLLTDLVAAATQLGVRALDATDALAAVEPGAFLDQDIHMTPKGHAALAAAVATKLREPAPLAYPGPGLPPGRSRVPTMNELDLAPEVTVKGSSRNHCSTRRVREWLLLDCSTALGPDLFPLGLPPDVAPWEGGEVLTGTYGRESLLLAPLVPGRKIRADYVWADHAEQLRVDWNADTPVIGFVPIADPHAVPPRPACVHPYTSWFGDYTRGCASTYADCEDQRVCASGSRAKLPECPAGQANAGSAGFCYPLCDTAHPCATGACEAWQGGWVCM